MESELAYTATRCQLTQTLKHVVRAHTNARTRACTYKHSAAEIRRKRRGYVGLTYGKVVFCFVLLHEVCFYFVVSSGEVKSVGIWTHLIYLICIYALTL